jgi:uncharacterized phiE125 gp8 family phage protein
MQPYGLILNTPPAEEPIALAEAKAHLRVEHADEDAVIEGLIGAAREFVEERSGRQLVTATWDITLCSFPRGRRPIKLPKWPTLSVATISYLDTNGDAQTWDAANYRVDTSREPALVAPAMGVSYPVPAVDSAAVTIHAVAGYGAAAAVPQAAKQAILLLVAHWYENREASTAGVANPEVMLSVESWLRLLDAGEWFS